MLDSPNLSYNYHPSWPGYRVLSFFQANYSTEAVCLGDVLAMFIYLSTLCFNDKIETDKNRLHATLVFISVSVYFTTCKEPALLFQKIILFSFTFFF